MSRCNSNAAPLNAFTNTPPQNKNITYSGLKHCPDYKEALGESSEKKRSFYIVVCFAKCGYNKSEKLAWQASSKCCAIILSGIGHQRLQELKISLYSGTLFAHGDMGQIILPQPPGNDNLWFTSSHKWTQTRAENLWRDNRQLIVLAINRTRSAAKTIAINRD